MPLNSYQSVMGGTPMKSGRKMARKARKAARKAQASVNRDPKAPGVAGGTSLREGTALIGQRASKGKSKPRASQYRAAMAGGLKA